MCCGKRHSWHHDGVTNINDWRIQSEEKKKKRRPAAINTRRQQMHVATRAHGTRRQTMRGAVTTMHTACHFRKKNAIGCLGRRLPVTHRVQRSRHPQAKPQLSVYSPPSLRLDLWQIKLSWNENVFVNERRHHTIDIVRQACDSLDVFNKLIFPIEMN